LSGGYGRGNGNISLLTTKTYKTAIISDKKKHYLGWTGKEGDKPDIVGMEGSKNDRPQWINLRIKY
jgi:hypothetical protein